jgi:hypothetical protein
MTVIDDRTSSRNYKKPNPANLLVDDATRLREAFDAIDADLAPTGYVFTTAQSNAVATIVSSAPSALQTLQALAAAINDDANFAATIQTALDDRYTEAEADSLFGIKGGFYGFKKVAGGKLELTVSNPNDASASITSADYTESALSPAGLSYAVTASGHLTVTI